MKTLSLSLLFSVLTPCVRLIAQAQSSQSGDPRWTQGYSLAQAPLPAKLKQRIWHALGGDADPPDMQQKEREATRILPFTVGSQHQRRKLLRVWAGGDLCGATGNCDILIVDAATGEVLLNGFGFDFEFKKTHHAGAPDIYTVANSSCCSGGWETYRYDGKRYRPYKGGDYTFDPDTNRVSYTKGVLLH